jgi:hypothetical protein
MPPKTLLKLLFSSILITLTVYNGWASTQQALPDWGGLTSGPDRYWTIATFLDAYYGFLTFYVWVYYKETRWLKRLGWFVAIMALGNMAMSAYVLLQLMRLRPDEDASSILISRRT